MRFFFQLFLNLHILIYRISGGKLANKMVNMEVLILHSIGRKTGKKRVIPITYFKENDDYILTASNGGAPKNPGWYHNLKNNPQTVIEINNKTIPVTARQASPQEKERLWAKLITITDQYKKYKNRTNRDIPMMILTPNT